MTNEPEVDKSYFLEIEIRREGGDPVKGKALGHVSSASGIWTLTQIFIDEKISKEDMSRIHVTEWGEIPEELPVTQAATRFNELAVKNPVFENKLGLILETVEGMIVEFWGDSGKFAEAMIEAGYMPFETLEPLPNFPKANKIFKSPVEWEGKREAGDLAVHYDMQTKEVTSIWKSLSPAHRLRFFLDGILSLTIHGAGMPPVSLISGNFPDLKPYDE